MKTSQKILLSALSLALLATSIQAAKKRGREGDNEQQPSATQAARVSPDALLNQMFDTAHTALTTAFPILVTGAGPSSPPAITQIQLQALRQAAGTLKMIMLQLATNRRATRGLDTTLQHFDALADDCIRAIESVVLDTRSNLTQLAEAIDGYNDARDRRARATGEPIPRLRDAAIANEHGQFRYADDEIAAYDTRIPDLLMVGDTAVAASAHAPAIQKELPADWTCGICLDGQTETSNPAVHLPCKQTVPHAFHKECLVNWFKPTIEKLDIPTCPMCKKTITGDNMPRELIGAVPTVDPINLLFTGAFNGSSEFVQRALDMGLNVNTKKPANPDDDEYDGCTALHIAVDQDHSEIVALLLARGADITATDTIEWTPVHFAAMRPGDACLRQLITHGQSLGIEAKSLTIGNSGRLPLHIAAEYNNIENICLLLGTDNLHINTPTATYKNTALILAAKNGYIEIVKKLLDTPGIDVNAVTPAGNTALIFAAQQGHTEIVQALLAHRNINVNAATNDGFTALMLATLAGYTKIVQALLDHSDVDVNAAKLYDGETALMIAAQRGRTEIVQALVNHHDINVNAVTPDHKTALMIAAQNGRTETVHALVNHQAIQLHLCDGSIE